jgi:putative nucleotidyltransferase with HDIG domain
VRLRPNPHERWDAITIDVLPKVGKFVPIVRAGVSSPVRAASKRGATNMSRDPAILLISDRTDRSQRLAHVLGALCTCRTVGLYEQKNIAGPVTTIVTDVGLRHPPDILRLRRVLLQPHLVATPIVAVLRENNYLERVQATALGASHVLAADASISDISAMLAPIISSSIPQTAPGTSETPAQNVERAQLQFRILFGAAAHGEIVNRASVDGATTSVVAAIVDGGIRQWLDIVWTYDDTTYQHCLLVTGLAAAFAAKLGFSSRDQQHLVRGALLHDLGKAKIPHAILNKPGPLTSDEVAVMRTHVTIGYELLSEQGDYPPELLEVVLRHHELLDGSGYPDGLRGSQISDLVRIVTICDIYAALIERRPYRRFMEPAQAFNTLQEMEGKLEGALVRAFAQIAEKSAAQVSPNRPVVAIRSGPITAGQ